MKCNLVAIAALLIFHEVAGRVRAKISKTIWGGDKSLKAPHLATRIRSNSALAPSFLRKEANAASYLPHSVNPNRDEQTVVDGDDGDDADWGGGEEE